MSSKRQLTRLALVSHTEGFSDGSVHCMSMQQRHPGRRGMGGWGWAAGPTGMSMEGLGAEGEEHHLTGMYQTTALIQACALASLQLVKHALIPLTSSIVQLNL